MPAITVSETQLAAWTGAFFWPLVRILALLGTAPAFSHQAIPVRAKVAFGVAIALVIAPTVQSPPLGNALDGVFFEILVRNILVGATLGFAVRALFSGVEFAGEVIGLEIGMSFGGFYNPEMPETDTPVTNLVSLLVLLLFLTMNGHLMLLAALRRSFDVFPVAGGGSHQIAFDVIAGLGKQVFSIALSVSLPILATMFLINLILGIMARVSPQLNLFAVGFPITLSGGLLLLAVFLPYLEEPIRRALEQAIAIWPQG